MHAKMKQIIGSLTFSYFHAQSSLQGKGPRHASAVHQYFFSTVSGISGLWEDEIDDEGVNRVGYLGGDHELTW